MNIETPVNTKAKVHIPTGKISNIQEGNKSIAKMPSITVLKSIEQETILEIGSGSYFISTKTRH